MPFPSDFTLTTERFLLRQPTIKDISRIFSASRVPGFTDGMLWEPPQHESELIEVIEGSCQAWASREGFSFTVTQATQDELLGRISIRKTENKDVWNIGFWTHPDVQNQGIMTEIIPTILRFGFEQLNAQRIEAEHALWNKASEKVLTRNGMQFVSTVEKGFQKKGQWVPENKVAIDVEDWRAMS